MRLVIYFAVLINFSLLIFDGGKQKFSCNFKQSEKKAEANADSADLSRAFLVTGKVTQSYSYCGGANPPIEVISNLAKPVAYPNKKFYIREGTRNSTKARIVKNFTTDSSGFFSISLLPGNYSIILPEQVDVIHAKDYKKQYQQVNEKCLQDWWVKPYYVLEVTNKDIVLPDFNFLHPCFIEHDIPCITYDGPMPL